MISDESMAQLLAMDFTQEQCERALTVSNNDVEQALNYLLDEDKPAPLDSYNPQLPDTSFTDSIRTRVDQTDSSVSDFQTLRHDHGGLNDDIGSGHIRIHDNVPHGDYEMGPRHNPNPGVVAPPTLPQRPNPSSGARNIGGLMDEEVKKTLSSYVDRDLTPGSDNMDRYSDHDIFDDYLKQLRPEYLPPILVSPVLRLIEANLAPLLTILHEVTSFRNLILQHDFNDYGFTKNWFKGERVNLSQDLVSRFIFETQKLVAFLDGDSERFFASIKGLIDSFPNNLKEYLQNVESVDDFFTSVYNVYISELRKTNDLIDSSFENLFHCKFHNSGGSDVNASCFPIEFEQIRSNMYQSLHNIIKGENMERADDIDISQFSDIITIPILNPEDNYYLTSSQGITVPEIFYPQIYSKNYDYVYKDIALQIADLNHERQQISKTRQSLTSFRGQKVADALKSSLEALNSEIEDLTVKIELEKIKSHEKLANLTVAAKDLENFCQSFQTKLELLLEQWLEINQKLESFDLTTEINTMMEGKEDPYMLIGAIFDESSFYYLTKDRDPAGSGENQWISVKYSNKTFHLGNSSFKKVEENIVAVTGNPMIFSNSIILIYCRQSYWNNDEMKKPIPTGLEKFMTEDRAYLHEVLKFMDDSTSDSSDSVEDAEEDEVDDLTDVMSDDDQVGYHELQDNLVDISPVKESSQTDDKLE